MTLDPHNLTADASLNRVRIVDLPGVRLPEGVAGNKAFDLLSTNALAACIIEYAGRLHLGDVSRLDPRRLPRLLDPCFTSLDEGIRDAANAIAKRYGRRLGYLIATLKRGDAPNRAARAEWDDTYWQHWSGIRQIWLGGGIVSGHLGPIAVGYAKETLLEAGVTDCALTLSAYPSILPMTGSARCAPPGTEAMAVFDFGNSFNKRAIALYKDGTLTGLRLLPTLAGEWATPDHEVEPEAAAHSLAAYIVETIAETCEDADQSGLRISSTIVASLASYINKGHPDPLQIGIYGDLRFLSANATGWFTNALSERLNRPAKITLLHDGTAAAKTYAGPTAQYTAVITLGTALGVGFPPSDAGLSPIAPQLAIEVL